MNRSLRSPSALCALVLAGFALPARAQITEAWSQTDSTFSAGGFQVDASGRSVVTGVSVTPSQAFLMLRDASGATTWSRTFDLGTATDETFGAARFAASGDFLIAGSVASAPSAPFSYHALLARYDATGNLLWWHTTPTQVPPGYEQPGPIIEAQNGDILCAGSAAGPTSEDFAVWRWDAQGNLLWRATVGGTQNRLDSVSRIALAANGDIVVVGTANSYPPVNSDILLARISPTGTVL